MLKIGSHVGLSGKRMFLGSVEEALSYNANTFMVYTGAPQNTRRKKMSEFKIDEAYKLMIENNINIDDIIVHAPYILNLGNPDDEKHSFSVRFLRDEINRTAELGIKQIVLHPGTHVGTGEDEGLKRIISGINKVLNEDDSEVKIALETMAGKGTECGRNFEQIAKIIDGVQNNDRLTVCFDTCHTFDAGYSIKDDFDGVINEFDKVIGKDKISAFHINDSKNPQGSRKDRHENIGFGYIGFDALNYIVHYNDFKDIPKILETPYIKTDENKIPPYLEEIQNFYENKFDIHGVLLKVVK